MRRALPEFGAGHECENKTKAISKLGAGRNVPFKKSKEGLGMASSLTRAILICLV